MQWPQGHIAPHAPRQHPAYRNLSAHSIEAPTPSQVAQQAWSDDGREVIRRMLDPATLARRRGHGALRVTLERAFNLVDGKYRGSADVYAVVRIGQLQVSI